jgi:DNA-binding response OmpR family regulator
MKILEGGLQMISVLIVEDEPAISSLIYMGFTRAGYNCTAAGDGERAADLIEENEYDLVLLDIMLPKVNGYELMEYIAPMNVPVIFLTARDSTKDKVKGLRLGADDYIAKPFEMDELIARAEAVLRRYNKTRQELEVLDVVIHTSSRQVTKGNEVISLTPKEYDLLLELVRNKNIVMERGTLYEAVWETEFTGDTRTLDLHIQRLRRKLDWKDVIKTVFRFGYVLEVEE